MNAIILICGQTVAYLLKCLYLLPLEVKKLYFLIKWTKQNTIKFCFKICQIKLHTNQLVWYLTIKKRRRQDSNLRGQSPIDF